MMKLADEIDFPHNLQLLIDENGTIIDTSSHIQHLVHHSKKDLKGLNISEVLTPYSPSELQFTNINFIKQHKVCPNNLFVSFTYNRTSVLDIDNIFLLNYSKEWREQKKWKNLVLLLVPQRYKSVISYPMVTEYHRAKRPYVGINEKNKIEYFSGLISYVFNVFNQSKIYGANLFDFVDQEYQHPGLFSNKILLDYITKTAQLKGNAWRTIFNLFSKTDFRRALSIHFQKNKTLKIYHKAKSLTFSPTQSPLAVDTGFLIFKKAVNFPGQDFKIEMSLEMDETSAFTIACGYPFEGENSPLFDHGYVFDMDLIGCLVIHASKLGAQKAVTKCEDIRSGQPFSFCMERIGAYHSITINQKQVLAFADPNPVPEKTISHLYFYFWDKKISIHKMNIFARPSLLDMDRIFNHQEFVSFKRSPGKLYSFKAEPVRYLNRNYTYIHFSPVPVLLKRKRSPSRVILFEEARRHIEQNFFNKIDFQKMAEKCCLSYMSFIRKFKSLYGLPPKAFQIECRLNEAKVLIRSGKYTIREVGHMVGIEDEVQFQHLFKKYFKLSPRKWADSQSD
jgi:AraC-like DNA-binding protein